MAIEAAGLVPDLAEAQFTAQGMIDQVVSGIRSSKIIIADVTEERPQRILRDTVKFGNEESGPKNTKIHTKRTIVTRTTTGRHTVTSDTQAVVHLKQVDAFVPILVRFNPQSAVWGLVAEVRERLLPGLQPDGFNIGANDGSADNKANYWAK